MGKRSKQSPHQLYTDRQTSKNVLHCVSVSDTGCGT